MSLDSAVQIFEGKKLENKRFKPEYYYDDDSLDYPKSSKQTPHQKPHQLSFGNHNPIGYQVV